MFGRATAGGGNSRKSLDFDDEARKLFSRLGLDATGGGASNIYNKADPIWRDTKTGATIFVGNQQAAVNENFLRENKIYHIVNCTADMKNFHEDKFSYYRFNIAGWPSFGGQDELRKFIEPFFQFVDAVLAKGENVMVHCLAGAHRAGTTGCLCLMHYADMSHTEAVPVAQRLRPIIDLIGRFPELLRRYDEIRKEEKARKAGGS